jgi:hypothetical protein
MQCMVAIEVVRLYLSTCIFRTRWLFREAASLKHFLGMLESSHGAHWCRPCTVLIGFLSCCRLRPLAVGPQGGEGNVSYALLFENRGPRCLAFTESALSNDKVAFSPAEVCPGVI